MGLCRNTWFAACSDSRAIISSLLLSLLKVCPFFNLWNHTQCFFMIIFRMHFDRRKLNLLIASECLHLFTFEIHQTKLRMIFGFTNFFWNDMAFVTVRPGILTPVGFTTVTRQILSGIRLLTLQDWGASLQDLMTFSGSCRLGPFTKTSRGPFSCDECN